jgi:cytochrome c-type biogenesis protein CcmH
MIAWALTVTLLASAPSELVLTPEQETRALKLGSHLRCAVCQGLSIADSPSATARSQFNRVRELIAEGKSDEEIRQYFVARYGDWALLEPPASGVAWFAWVGPGLFVLAGLGLIGWMVRRGGGDKGGPTEPDPQEVES